MARWHAAGSKAGVGHVVVTDVIRDVLTNEEIVYLYKNCYAVIIPTLVGSISFPVIEGFFFKKPVIFGLKNIIEEYKNNILPLIFKTAYTDSGSIPSTLAENSLQSLSQTVISSAYSLP